MHSLNAQQQTTNLTGRRELDARVGDGFDVRLWCDPVLGQVAVTVAHDAAGLALEVAVRDGEAPLDVFHHPFAYAGGGR